MIEFDLIRRRVMPVCPGAAEPLVDTHILDAARTFCERTRAWKFDDEYDTEAETEYLAAPYGAEVFEIRNASWNGRALEARTQYELDHYDPDWRDRNVGNPSVITQDEFGSFRVVPHAPGRLRVSMVMKPAIDADQLPDVLAQYAEAIAWGALSTILVIPKQSFSAPELGMMYAQKFERRLRTLTSQIAKGPQGARMRTIPSWF